MGSAATWFAARVTGTGGEVLATDIDIRFLDQLEQPGLTVRRHDVVTDPVFWDLASTSTIRHKALKYKTLEVMFSACARNEAPPPAGGTQLPGK
jgi:hypothetical protein